jgi:hypothetical protein
LQPHLRILYARAQYHYAHLLVLNAVNEGQYRPAKYWWSRYTGGLPDGDQYLSNIWDVVNIYVLNFCEILTSLIAEGTQEERDLAVPALREVDEVLAECEVDVRAGQGPLTSAKLRNCAAHAGIRWWTPEDDVNFPPSAAAPQQVHASTETTGAGGAMTGGAQEGATRAEQKNAKSKAKAKARAKAGGSMTRGTIVEEATSEEASAGEADAAEAATGGAMKGGDQAAG